MSPRAVCVAVCLLALVLCVAALPRHTARHHYHHLSAQHPHAGPHQRTKAGSPPHYVPTTPVEAAEKPTLRFHDDGTFKIVQFTDLHFGVLRQEDIDARTVEILKTVVEAEEPDLVVLTGDVVTIYSNCTQAFFEKEWAQYTQPLVDAGVPWAWVSGNHDDEYCTVFPRTWLGELDSTYALSLTNAVKGLTGVNYVLPVLAADNDTVLTNVWMFDSGAYDCEGVSGYGCVARDVVQWYQKTATEINGVDTVKVPALGFMHIPLPEYMTAISETNVTGECWGESVACWSVDTGLFAAMQTVGDVQLVGCGHDHDNDYGGEVDGITLHYGRKTGHSSYGPPAGVLTGARVYTLTASPFTIETHVRQEDGTVFSPEQVHAPTSVQTVCS